MVTGYQNQVFSTSESNYCYSPVSNCRRVSSFSMVLVVVQKSNNLSYGMQIL